MLKASFFSLLFLTSIANATPLVAVVDGGADLDHPRLISSKFINPGEQANALDDDHNGFIDDISGWNLGLNSGAYFNSTPFKTKPGNYLKTLRMLDLMNKMESGTPLTFKEKAELAWLAFTLRKVIGLYILPMHGTHVAGIASARLPAVQVASVGLDSIFIEEPSLKPLKKRPPTAAELQDFLALIEKGEQKFFAGIGAYLATQSFIAVNMSWGQNANMFKGDLKRRFPKITEEQLAATLNQWAKLLMKIDARVMSSLPHMLFVIAAGNDSCDLDKIVDFPASVKLANTVAVAASDPQGRLADFSCYGRHSVEFAARGVGIVSTLPFNREGLMSGTSMAAPQVVNAAAAVKGAHPAIDAANIRRVLIATVDPRPDMEAKLMSGGEINTLRAVHMAVALKDGMSFGDARRIAFEKVPVGKLEHAEQLITFAEQLATFDAAQRSVISEVRQMLLSLPRTMGRK